MTGDNSNRFIHDLLDFRRGLQFGGLKQFNGQLAIPDGAVSWHKQMIMDACAKHLSDIPIIGAVRRSTDLTLPERHLGLVQAGEHRELDDFLDRAADIIAQDVDLTAFSQLVSSQSSLTAQSTANEPTPWGQSADIPPLGQHIAIARDTAFAFAYRHLLDGWARAGATLSFFSPLRIYSELRQTGCCDGFKTKA